MVMKYATVELNEDEYNIVELMAIKNNVKKSRILREICRMGLITMSRREVVGHGTQKQYKLK